MKHFIFLICAFLAFFCIEGDKSYVNADNDKEVIIYLHGDENINKIALTFDDGPNPPYTEEILDVLDEEGVKATFFLMGRHVLAHPGTAKDILTRGHAVGNHTCDHPDFRFVLEGDAVEKEIKKCEKIFKETLGYKTNIFRPTFTCSQKSVAKKAAKLGYFTIGWSVRPRDGSSTRLNSEKIIKKVISKTKNGSIILLHDGDCFKDGQDRGAIVDVVRVVVKDLKAKGFVFVTVPELLDLPDEG